MSALATESCSACKADGVEILDGYCPTCHWTPEETCAEWRDRIALVLPSCSCTATFAAPDAFASGYCKAHGVAWHTRHSR